MADSIQSIMKDLRKAADKGTAVYFAPDAVDALEAALAQPAPPAEGEVAELVEWLESQIAMYENAFESHSGAARLRRIAALLERHQQMEDLAADAVSALRYIEQQHGRLYGVGFDRVYEKADRLLPADPS